LPPEKPVLSIYTVRDNRQARRYEIEADGHVAATWYRLRPGVITFTHTEVPSALEGRGIGSALAKGVLDDARRRGLKVVPLCPFVAAYIERHPEYRDLVVPPGA